MQCVAIWKQEKERLEGVVARQDAEQSRLQLLPAHPLKSKKNRSGEDFDIVTLAYHDTPRGVKLQQEVS